MHLLALLMLVLVALFGGFILFRRRQHKPAGRWMVVGHGLGAVVGLGVLLLGVLELHFTDSLNELNLVALALVTSVVFGGFFLFEKLLKGKKKPLVVMAMHGVFAVVSLMLLAYSFTL